MKDQQQGWETCVKFHGHVCPGLATGFQVTRLALEELQVERAEDEELVAIVENDACGIDAVQALAGCTMGKGNLILKDYGKPVYTFGNRRTGAAIRIAIRRELAPDEPDIRRIRKKLQQGNEEPGDRGLLRQKMSQLVERILTISPRDYCKVEKVRLDFPPRAKIYESVICPLCGESVMETRTAEVGGQQVCLSCSADSQ